MITSTEDSNDKKIMKAIFPTCRDPVALDSVLKKTQNIHALTPRRKNQLPFSD